MRKHIFLSLLLFSISWASFSQPSNFFNVDYGLKLGAANYIGDIGGYDQKGQPFLYDMKMQETRWSFGAYFRYRIGTPERSKNNPFLVEAQINWVRITGADSLTTNYAPRKLRNLTFRNDIIQFNALAEWNFFENPDIGLQKDYQKGINAYVCSGISIFYQDPKAYNPYHEFNLPTWVNLHSLRTEAQLYDKTFHYIQPGIPIGVGINYTINEQCRIGWSITWTETFTDYLDGVSGDYPTQAEWSTLTPVEKYFSNRIESIAGIDPGPNGVRGEASNRDSFVTTTFNVGYIFKYHHIRRTRRGILWKHSKSKF
jgi:hypothetical protein